MPGGAAKAPDPAPGSGANGPTSQRTRRGPNGAGSGRRSCSAAAAAAAGCAVWRGQLHGNGRLHRGVGVPAPPFPARAMARSGGAPPRKRSAAEAATCAPSAGGRRGRATPVVAAGIRALAEAEAASGGSLGHPGRGGGDQRCSVARTARQAASPGLGQAG